jgi:sulfonate transport system substrate-binding protein
VDIGYAGETPPVFAQAGGVQFVYVAADPLESAQLKLSDVTVVYLAPADARSAFESGQVDAWVIGDPFLAAAERAGARVLKDGRELVDNHLYYVVERSFAEQSPAIVAAVLEQYRELSEWAKGHDQEAARILADSSGIAYEALLLAEHRHTYGIVPITPEILRKQQNIADTFHKLELIPKAIRIQEAFLPAAAYTASR